MARERGWAGLPGDALIEISNFLPFGLHHANFRAACSTWRSSTPVTPELPLLLLPTKNDDPTISLFSLHDSRTHEFPLPANARGKRLCGSSHGWLVFVDDGPSRSVVLCNPMSQACLNLPPMTYGWHIPPIGPDWTNSEPIKIDIRECHMYKAVLSANPATNPNNCFVSAIYDEDVDTSASILAICQLHEQTWTILEECIEGFYDARFYKNRLYALDKQWRLFVYEAMNTMVSRMWKFDDWSPRLSEGYLVVSKEELLAVLRYQPAREARCRMCRPEFFVYKLDESETLQPQADKIERLGDRAIFVGLNSSLVLPLPPPEGRSSGSGGGGGSISTSSSTANTGCRRDCVYYTNFQLMKRMEGPEDENCGDFGVFDMVTGMVDTMPDIKPKRVQDMETSIWFTPSLH